jgi:hypothetical protein
MLRTCSFVGPLVLTASLLSAAEGPAKGGLVLSPAQKEHLTLEPILVAVKLEDGRVKSLPATVGGKADVVLSFDVQPTVKARSGAKALPYEVYPQYRPASRRGSQPHLVKAEARRAGLFDLLEWFQFPAEGKFTVRAVVKQGDTVLTSAPITLSLRRPDRKDAEWGPVDRLHHMPWSNYCTNAFCGDTFDVAKRWPASKMTRYCLFYNGLHHQHKKEHDKAVASLRELVEKHPDFVLVPHAKRAILQSYLDQGNWPAANEHLAALQGGRK